MRAFSHSRKNKEGEREGSKYLIDHLQGVREKAINNVSGNLNFSFSEHELQEVIDAVCWLHDLGKYTSFFQTYLLKPDQVEWRLKNHSNLGAHVAFQLFKEEPEKALIAFYIIKLHHSNLLNVDKVLWPEDYSRIKLEEEEIFKKQVGNLYSYTELKDRFPALDENLFKLTRAKELFQLYKKYLGKQLTIEYYFIANYLFSLLIESDKLDASDTSIYKLSRLPEDAVEQRPGFGKPVYPKGPLKNYTQNQLRNYVRSKVLENLIREDILRRKIFMLAAPTGIGKTMTALDFVLKLRAQIERTENYLPQIIYGLPFINIIEQALDEYEKTLGTGKILGHYQYADIFGRDESNRNDTDDEELFYGQMKMAWDTWQSDIVITSFVQIFETLIGNRNRLLKKFHHFADSIIILDEVQTLSLEKLPVIGAVLYYLCKYLNTRVLIMTATQPKLFELMERELHVKIDDKHLQPLNLLPQDKEVFACFDRTNIVPLVNSKIDNDEFIKIFQSFWLRDKSSLIVVNKVSRSIELYKALCDLKKRLEFENPILYLSTNITPNERRKRVNWLKYKLRNGVKPILVSTQVVEAGVDLDFDMGFRDLGPIDSIVQVAGRVNRENSEQRRGSPLYVVDLGDCKRIYGHATDIQARKSLNKSTIHESEYKGMVEHYFGEISDKRFSDFSISEEVFEAMKTLHYAYPRNSTPSQKLTVSDFKIIDRSFEGVSIFVELSCDKEGRKAREAYQALLNGDLKRHLFDKEYKRTFNQRIIVVPTYLEKVAKLQATESLAEDILWIRPEDAESYYDPNIGFIRQQEETESVLMF